MMTMHSFRHLFSLLWGFRGTALLLSFLYTTKSCSVDQIIILGNTNVTTLSNERFEATAADETVFSSIQISASYNSTDNNQSSIATLVATTEPAKTLENTSSIAVSPNYIKLCPSNVVCDQLGADCIDCEFNMSCHYGSTVNVTCHAKPLIVCLGSHNLTQSMTCRYCYQTPAVMHRCSTNTGCRVASAPLQYYEANCTVRDEVTCLGQRRFRKMLPCNWTSGKRWSTALILSITLGGFGADRFYLGLWREGIGKLFSFGGLGVWTLVDVILVAAGYIGPADGSLYIS